MEKVDYPPGTGAGLDLQSRLPPAQSRLPPPHALPEGQAGGSAYRQVASGLRQAIAAGRYPAGQRLPTEAELVTATELSRQTVRRAFQELVTDGAIYRVRGRGTFAVPGEGKYRDRELRPLELAVNHFNPDRYSYRLQLRRVDLADSGPGPR
jgi:GntR family transcriptional regulator